MSSSRSPLGLVIVGDAVEEACSLLDQAQTDLERLCIEANNQWPEAAEALDRLQAARAAVYAALAPLTFHLQVDYAAVADAAARHE